MEKLLLVGTGLAGAFIVVSAFKKLRDKFDKRLGEINRLHDAALKQKASMRDFLAVLDIHRLNTPPKDYEIVIKIDSVDVYAHLPYTLSETKGTDSVPMDTILVRRYPMEAGAGRAHRDYLVRCAEELVDKLTENA